MNINIEECIREFNSLGYDVAIRHHRFYDDDSHGYVISPKGGSTVVYIGHKGTDEKEGEIVITGEAVCSEEDNYNKRLGVTIALGRARHKLYGRGKTRTTKSIF
jgi:hypothetical protein